MIRWLRERIKYYKILNWLEVLIEIRHDGKKFVNCVRDTKRTRFNLPVIVQSSRKHSSRLLMTARVLWSSRGASKNGNMAAPISEYKITMTHRPGVENRMRNVKCTQRFVCITFTVSSLSTTISPSLVSICDISPVYTFIFCVCSQKSSKIF